MFSPLNPVPPCQAIYSRFTFTDITHAAEKLNCRQWIIKPSSKKQHKYVYDNCVRVFQPEKVTVFDLAKHTAIYSKCPRFRVSVLLMGLQCAMETFECAFAHTHTQSDLQWTSGVSREAGLRTAAVLLLKGPAAAWGQICIITLRNYLEKHSDSETAWVNTWMCKDVQIALGLTELCSNYELINTFKITKLQICLTVVSYVIIVVKSQCLDTCGTFILREFRAWPNFPFLPKELKRQCSLPALISGFGWRDWVNWEEITAFLYSQTPKIFRQLTTKLFHGQVSVALLGDLKVSR